MWIIKYLDEALKEIEKLDGSIIKQVFAGIRKVSVNPLSKCDGGFGNPLGHKNHNDLTGFFKIKYRNIGIRVIYTLVFDVKIMNIIVVSKREDDQCYKFTQQRKEKYGEKLFTDSLKNLDKK